jgi:predicted nucleotidyltransferase
MKNNDLRDKLKNRIKTIKLPQGIVGLYLYGSVLNDNLRTDSDIDVGMLTSYRVKPIDRLNLIAVVEAEIKSLFASLDYEREISVLDMRGKYVSVPLLFKVVTEGFLFYEKNRNERINFENAIKSEYFDLKPYIDSLIKEKYEDLLKKTGTHR